jgi:hypothetical protein
MPEYFSYLSWFQILLLMVGLMSGVFSLFREVFLIKNPEKAKDGHLFWRCVFITFIISSVWLWVSEHQQTLALQAQLDGLTVPSFDGYFADVITERGAVLIVTVDGKIWNRGAPSAIVDWKMNILLNDGTILHGNVSPPITVLRYNMPSGGNLTFRQENYWAKLDGPTAHNGQSSGWLTAQFHNISHEELIKRKAQIALVYTDVNRKEWTTKEDVTAENQHEPYVITLDPSIDARHPMPLEGIQ